MASFSIELVNTLGVTREEVPLDYATAAEILASSKALYAKETSDLSQLFGNPAENQNTDDPATRFYPDYRRYEVPYIEITPPHDTDEGAVYISAGRIESIVEPDTDLQEPAKSGFWKESGALESGFELTERHFGSKGIRNKAPVIWVGAGEISLNMQMQEITGAPPLGLYEDRAFMGPDVQIRAPEYEGDPTAFVQVSSVEVGLPVIEAAILKVN